MASIEKIRVAVIMAGGSGERFWPLSRRLRPKQLLRLASPDRNLLEEAVERIRPLIPPERCFVATSTSLQEPIRAGRIGIPDENVLAEPCKRNTAGCLAYAAATVLSRLHCDPVHLSMAVLTADHLIPETGKFLACVEAALAAAERERALGVIGVPPTRPETGYGYIEIPEGAEPLAHSSAEHPVYPVHRFREKPNLETAEEFIATGHFFWNSGMFFWTLAAFLREMERASPSHAHAVRAMRDAMQAGAAAEVERVFAALPDISIDYALMEKARRVVMARAGFAWDDIGAWDSLDRTHPNDADGNVAIGEPVLVDTENCIVYNDCGPGKMAVAAVGVENLVIIVTQDGVLVIPKDRAQDVRKAVARLKENNAPQL